MATESVLDKLIHVMKNGLNANEPEYMDLLNNPQKIGLNHEDLAGKNEQQKLLLIIGEYFAKISEYSGKIASELLFRSQWNSGPPPTGLITGITI